jgi:hypothetical protein
MERRERRMERREKKMERRERKKEKRKRNETSKPMSRTKLALPLRLSWPLIRYAKTNTTRM